MVNRTRTPCVGICSTTYGDDVCRGCKRFSFEVIKQVSESFSNLDEFGIDVFEKNKSLTSLKEEIENELYTLSKAHYEKYFIEPLNRNKSM